jgi:hypothetical protein
MKLFVTIYNDSRLLGHFLRHYAAAGVGEFHIAVAPGFMDDVETFADRYVIHLHHLPDDDTALGGAAAVTQMRMEHQGANEWVIIVDLDEFVEFPIELEALVSRAEAARANVVRGIMHDRFSADGRLRGFGPESKLDEVYPIKSRFIRDVMGGCDHKGVLVKGRIRPPPASGHHRFVDEVLSPDLLEISHYKWIPGAVDRVRATHRLVSEAGIRWAPEFQRALDHYDAPGRFAGEDFGGGPAAEFVVEAPVRCTDCGAPVSEAEQQYSLERFGRRLCRFDQNRRRAATHAEFEP